jgi:O-methyltransferase
LFKTFLKLAINKIFSLVGYDVTFGKKGIQSNVVVDKNVWESYFSNDQKMQLYYEGLKRSKNESTDNFYKQLRHYSLQELVYHVIQQKLNGDFVECGVWKGHSAYIISSILSENGFKGVLHIFDSFEEGLSVKTKKDKNFRDELTEKQVQEEASLFASTENEVSACLSEFQFVHLYKGWIPSRFIEVEDRQFAFVHIDVDLYEPILDSLNFFFPRLVEGGVIVFDDYGITQFPGAKKAVDEFLKKNTYQFFYKVPMGSSFVIK